MRVCTHIESLDSSSMCIQAKRVMWIINPFSTNVPLLYPLETSENQRFSDIFRGYRSGTLVENDLKDEEDVNKKQRESSHTDLIQNKN